MYLNRLLGPLIAPQRSDRDQMKKTLPKKNKSRTNGYEWTISIIQFNMTLFLIFNFLYSLILIDFESGIISRITRSE